MEKDLAVYVLVRNDLPSMNAGKMAAQVHHAGVQMMAYGQRWDSKLIKEYVDNGVASGADDFNTTLVLSANLQQIINVVELAKKIVGVPCGVVKDPSYPFFVEPELVPFVEKDTTVTRIGPAGNKELFVRPEVTCGWVLLDRNDPVMRAIVGTLPLHP